MADGRKDFDVQNEQHIRDIVNPQRQPPLPSTLTFGLKDPRTAKLVHYDDCRESDGAMIEVKGPGFANMLRNAYLEDKIADEWIDQAQRQVDASGGRPIEWYFAEEAAAVKAKQAFGDIKELKHISFFHVPPEAE